MGYFWGFNLMRDMIGDKHVKMAQLFAIHISGMIDEEVEQIKMLSNSSIWREMVEEGNLKYDTMQQGALYDYFINMDKKWIEAGDEDPLFK